MQWHSRALADVERVRTAESRLVSALGAGETAVVAAADEVEVATRDAMAWLVDNPVSDSVLAARVARMVKAYAALEGAAREMALYPRLEPREARARLSGLISVVDHQSEKLNPWL
jgi:hypothetical protein